MKYSSTLRVYILAMLTFGFFVNSQIFAQSTYLDINPPSVDTPENSRLAPSIIFRIESTLTGPSEYFDYLEWNFTLPTRIEQVSPGVFHIYDFPLFNTYTYEFKGNSPVLLGVTGADIALLQKYILGVGSLDPDKILAADVTGDGRVSVSDLVDIRKVILGKKPNFASNINWKFIPATVNFMYTGTTIDLGTIKAIKVGNVN